MISDWEQRVAQFWATADDSQVELSLAQMKSLVEELDQENPDGMFEWASVHDFLGLELQAIPLYERALDLGLVGLKREKALIQLASSLRNVGRPDDAIAILEENEFGDETFLASRSFLALAMFDAGKPSEALRQTLEYLYPSDALYARSILFYARQLPEGKS